VDIVIALSMQYGVSRLTTEQQYPLPMVMPVLLTDGIFNVPKCW
jgi:hypothetical protein